MKRTKHSCLFLLVIFSSVLLKAHNLDSLQNLMDSLEIQHQALAAKQDFENASKMLARYNDVAFRYQSVFDSTQVQDMKAQYQLDLRAAEIEVEEARLANQIRIIFISLGVGLLLLITILLVRREIRRKARKEAERFLESQLRREAEANLKAEQLSQSESEKQQLAEILELKNQRLSAQMLQLLNKNQLLLQIQEKVDKLETEPGLWRELKAEVEQEIHPEEDWAAFLKQFEQLYPDFFPRLREIQPDITVNDLKLAILLRLQLSSKEMASLLGLTPDSVKTARYRLSKKLALPKGEKLQDFLMQVV